MRLNFLSIYPTIGNAKLVQVPVQKGDFCVQRTIFGRRTESNTSPLHKLGNWYYFGYKAPVYRRANTHREHTP
jgi:hypothetical protein